VVRVLSERDVLTFVGNELGAEGVVSVLESLKGSTCLTALDLSGDWIFSIFWLILQTIHSEMPSTK
jgi:hypothetical protein